MEVWNQSSANTPSAHFFEKKRQGVCFCAPKYSGEYRNCGFVYGYGTE